MTQTTTQNEPSIGIDDDILADAILERKNTVLSDLSSEEKYVIKSLQNGQFNDAYDGILDFSTDEGKNAFNFYEKLITKNNWFVIPANLYQKYTEGSVSLEALEESVTKNHEKLGIEKPVFEALKEKATEQQPQENNDFISKVSDVEKTPAIKSLTEDKEVKTSGIVNGEAVKAMPSDILSNFDGIIKHKINELNYYKSKVEKNKGKVSLNTLLAAGGVFALGVVFSPLSALTVPTAIAIGGFAVLKGMFGQNSDIKNYDKQIEALKEATAKMVLKSTGEDTKQNVANFVKNNKDLVGTLFDEKIEAEFVRICKVKNIKIDSNVFKNAAQYDNGHVIDYNRNSKKPKA